MHKVYKNKMVKLGQTIKKAKLNKPACPEPERFRTCGGGK